MMYHGQYSTRGLRYRLIEIGRPTWIDDVELSRLRHFQAPSDFMDAMNRIEDK
jgi:hypothetical protein